MRMRNAAATRLFPYRRPAGLAPEWNAPSPGADVPTELSDIAHRGHASAGAGAGRIRSSTNPVGGHTKRCFDLAAAATGLLLLLPLFCLIALAIKVIDRGPALYRHRRIGRNGMPFDCLKFRT